MEQIYLKDICDLDNGYAFKSDDYVDISHTLNCRMSNIRPDGSFDIMYNAKYLPDEYAEKYKDYLLKDGDLIIAMTDMAGDPKILGVPTVVDTKGYNLLLNQRVGKLRFIKDGVDADYLKLALQSKNVRSYLKRFAGGGVQLNVSKKDILNSPVQMRTKEEQEYIVTIFTKLKSIINQRKNELDKLDELVKGRFVELFKGFIESAVPVDFEKICEFVTVGIANSATHAFYDDGVIMFRNQNIKEDYLDTSDIVYITPDFADKYKTKRLKKNDLLIVRTGYPGVACLVPEQFEGSQTFTTLIARIKNDASINPRFVCHYINSEYGKRYVKDNSAGAAQQNFGATALSKLPICIPPIESQDEYIRFVAQVDKSKVAVQKALDEAQLLFDSLMQKYFG